MAKSNLKLFRRHEKECVRNYPKEFRVYQWMTETQKGKAAVKDCSCTIYAEGTLVKNSSKVYVRPKSTGEGEWTTADAVKQNWLTWGSTTRPADMPEPLAEPGELATIQAAAQAFLDYKKTQLETGKILKPRYDAAKSFVDLRLIPFATMTKGLQYIQDMDNEEVWKEFIRSWKCLDDPTKPILQGTLRWLIGMLREFLSFCVRKEWLSDNWASNEYGVVKTLTIEPKEPFSETELSYIYRAAEEIRDGAGCMIGSGEERAKELQAFILTLRHTGLRISDATRLEVSQLQRFNHAGYRYAISCNPKKTRRMKMENFVHIPIPDDVAERLAATTPKQGKYFFKAGSGLLKTATQEWRERIKVAFNRAEELMEKAGITEKNATHFGAASQTWEKPTPHKFRHTFAATLLQGGASVRLVGQWLGDTEETVRLHYAKFCREEQKQAAEIFANAMRNYQSKQPPAQPARLRLVK